MKTKITLNAAGSYYDMYDGHSVKAKDIISELCLLERLFPGALLRIESAIKDNKIDGQRTWDENNDVCVMGHGAGDTWGDATDIGTVHGIRGADVDKVKGELKLSWLASTEFEKLVWHIRAGEDKNADSPELLYLGECLAKAKIRMKISSEDSESSQ